MRQALLAALLLAGCNSRPTSAVTAEDAIEVTRLYRAEYQPRANSDVIVRTEDRGDRWLVSYTLRGGGTGGLSYYEVEKSSARILDHGALQ